MYQNISVWFYYIFGTNIIKNVLRAYPIQSVLEVTKNSYNSIKVVVLL